MTLSVFMGMAQTKGSITYDMTFSSDNPDMAMVSSMMAGSKMTISFMPGKSKVAMSMGMFGKFSTITDVKKKKMLVLVDVMGEKNAAYDKLDKDKVDSPTNVSVKFVDETKVIMGYTCKKAIGTDSEGNEITYWYTEDIKADLSGQKQFNSNVPGVILEFATIQKGMTINFVATGISEEVDKAEFDMKIPEGYTEKSIDEIKTM